MSKAATSLSMILLAAIFLLGLFGVIAGLDEFVRVPFYHSLLIAAAAVNGTMLLLLWRRKTANHLSDRIRWWLRFAQRGLRREPAASIDHFEFNVVTDTPAMKIQPRVRQEPSLQEIANAFGNVHSVAWGFPVSKRTVSPRTQEGRVDHEALQ